MLKNSKKIIFGVFGLLGFVLVLTATYAFFSSTSIGDQITSLTTNGVTFSYKEGTNSIRLNNAMPMTDEEGMYSSNYFEFDITANTPEKVSIPYYITARKGSKSSNIDDAIKLYLTKATRATKDMYAIHAIENNVENNICDDLTGVEKEYYKADCNKMHSVGDLYNAYTIRIEDDLEFNTIQECENSNEYTEALANGVEVECILRNEKYIIQGYLGTFNDSTSCLEYLGNENGECIIRQIPATTNLYHNEYFNDERIFDDIESCETFLQTIPVPSYITASCSLFHAAGDVISEEEVLLTNYDELNQFSHNDIDVSKYTEKLLYDDVVPFNSTNYKETYRLRAWIDYDTDFSQSKYNNANFALTVNVYSSGAEKPKLAAGLYDANDNLIASYEELVNDYGWDLSQDELTCYKQDLNSWYCYNEDESVWTYPPTSELPDNMLIKILENNEFNSVTKVVLPTGLTKIPNSTFANCTNLTSVQIPASVTSIGDYAFSYCLNLSDVNLPSSLVTIGDHAFEHCGNIEELILPSGLLTIGDSAFNECEKLNVNGFPTGLTTIGEDAFSRCNSLTSIEIPASVTAIGNAAFAGCENLVSADIKANITTLSTEMFSYDVNLTTLTLPSTITTIERAAVTNTSIRSITLPNSLITIENAAFSGNTELTSIEIPASVTTIGNWGFSGCTNLATVTVGENSNLSSIDPGAFDRTLWYETESQNYTVDVYLNGVLVQLPIIQ